jgi:hypothetical protein
MNDYKPMSDGEIKALAMSIFKGEVYTDRHLPKGEDIMRIFTVLMMMDKTQIDDFNANPPGLIYEHIDEASPMACNGQPMFFGMHWVSQTDAAQVWTHYHKIQAAMEALQ